MESEAAIEPEPDLSGVHPRILARIRTVRLTEVRKVVLALLAEGIEMLDTVCQVTDQFLTVADTLRELQEQVASISIEDPRYLPLMGDINDFMVCLQDH